MIFLAIFKIDNRSYLPFSRENLLSRLLCYRSWKITNVRTLLMPWSYIILRTKSPNDYIRRIVLVISEYLNPSSNVNKYSGSFLSFTIALLFYPSYSINIYHQNRLVSSFVIWGLPVISFLSGTSKNPAA